MSFYRSTLFQLIVVGIVALLAPGFWNAVNSLGAGGALEPYLVNAGNSLVFGLMGLFCIFAPIFVNKIGLKLTLVLGTLGYPVYSAALYQNNRYGTEWFVIFGAAICGISAGLYWAAEGCIVLSYPEHSKRGRYLALWLGFKNSGQVIGGAINLGLNANTSVGGKISFVTLLVFVVLQVVALPVALLLSPPHKTIRKDGSTVLVEQKTSTHEQLRLLWKAISTRQVGFLLPLFFASWFYWGYVSTYLTLYFSVRARALASFLSAITGTIATTLLGIFLDSQRLSVRARLRYGYVFVSAVFTLLWIWVLVVQHDYVNNNPGHLDWLSPGFGRGFGIYIMLNTAGNMVQNYLYFLVGTIGEGTSQLSRSAGLLRGVESWGQCVAFGINSSTFSPLYTVVINVVLWTVSLVPATISVWNVQERPEHAEKLADARSESSEPSQDEKTVSV